MLGILETALLSCSILAVLLIAEAWILRLPCKTEGEFSVKVKGYALENSFIGKHTVPYVNNCIGKCFDENKCKSINFKDTGTDNCELNDKIRENSTSANFKARENWVYLSTDYNTTKIGSACEAVGRCESQSICLDTCECPWYMCLKCDSGTNLTRLHGELCSFVENTENIALGKTANQSSTLHKYTAKFAVDGILGSGFTHTLSEESPWWRVDLGQTAVVQSVTIQNRPICLCYTRLNPFDVRVGDSLVNNGRDNKLCVQNGSFLYAGQVKRFQCMFPVPGRYVSIHLNRRVSLELSEVQVYGFFYID